MTRTRPVAPAAGAVGALALLGALVLLGALPERRSGQDDVVAVAEPVR